MYQVLAVCLIPLACCLPLNAAEETATPPVKNPDATIVKQMRERWQTPERLRWRIAYHPIKGMTGSSSWHIKGTHWWARVHPEWVKLDEFDKSKEYELDAVALDQNYGVIDFYVYRKDVVK